MNNQKSLMELLLVSTAALSGYHKGTRSGAYLRNSNSDEQPNSYTPQTPDTTAPQSEWSSYAQSPYTTVQTSKPISQQSQNTPSPPSIYSPNMNIQSSFSSATEAAQTDCTFNPALLAALYAADAAVNMNPDTTGPFTLPPLEYDYNALEPYISEATLRTHHEALHQRYVDNLNIALARYPEFYQYTLEELLLFPDRLPSDIQAQILNNAGGHYNHSLTWKLIGPNNRNQPTGNFAQAVNSQFFSFENMKTILKEAAESVVGTGYAWLALNPYGRMIVVTSEEQLTPIALRSIPLLPIDVWEHAYFLDYLESRSDFLDHLFCLIDWERVGERYNAALEALGSANQF